MRPQNLVFFLSNSYQSSHRLNFNYKNKCKLNASKRRTTPLITYDLANFQVLVHGRNGPRLNIIEINFHKLSM
jgi:hypothetical protein